VEQNQEDWYGAACLAVREVVRTSAVPPKQVEAIALSGTSHVPSLLDKRMALLRPAILWNDIMSEAQVKRLESEVGGLIRARTGNSDQCTWSLAQLVWVRENEPLSFPGSDVCSSRKTICFYRLTVIVPRTKAPPTARDGEC
jgi:xylulokinase